MSRISGQSCRLLRILGPARQATKTIQGTCRWASSNNSPPSTEELLRKVYAAQQQPASTSTPQPPEPNFNTDSAARKGGFGPFPQPENPSKSGPQGAGPRVRPGPSAQRPSGSAFREPTSFKVQRLGSNLVSFSVFGAGLLLTLTIVYSFSTEVLASGSATSVFNHCTPILQASDELHSILRSPLSFHGTPPHLRTRRNHHIASTLAQRPDGTQEMRVKFWVDGAAKSNPSEGIWNKAKRTIFRPIIVEPINQPLPQQHQQVPAEQQRKKQESEKMSWGDWFKSGFAAIIPSSGSGQGGGALKSSSSSSYPAKPQLGAYETGEVSAALIRVSDGSFQLKTLVVDFREPGKHPWRVHVINKSDQQVIEDFEAKKQSSWMAHAKSMVGLGNEAK